MAACYLTWAPYFVSSHMEKWIFIAHLLSVIILPPAALVTLWNVWVTFRTQTGWRASPSRFWSIAVCASSLTIFYVAVMFHLAGVSVAF
jgi:hypothetical protein